MDGLAEMWAELRAAEDAERDARRMVDNWHATYVRLVHSLPAGQSPNERQAEERFTALERFGTAIDALLEAEARCLELRRAISQMYPLEAA